ncbi:MAG: 4Fe-4S binding protein [Proteobacteria bacterium]|nr:4Fe-4S binding protein [Pseudomonadota bacterium]
MSVCPVDCIFSDEVDRMCYVHPTKCIDCAACESACPVGAIFKEDDVPNAASEFTSLNAQWFEEPEVVRARIDALVEQGLAIT